MKIHLAHIRSTWIILFAIIVLAGLAVAISRSTMDSMERQQIQDITSYQHIVVHLEGTTIDAEIADTNARRDLGLSGRDALADGTGMLFLFNNPGKYAFWMKDMKFPIDIIWIGQDLRVVDISANVSEHSYPRSFYPSADAQYVLEVPAGYAGAHHIAAGSVVTLDTIE